MEISLRNVEFELFETHEFDASGLVLVRGRCEGTKASGDVLELAHLKDDAGARADSTD
jgi:hypothetical protein